MLIIILSLIIASILALILKKVAKERNIVIATFSIFIFFAGTLLFTYILAPTTKSTTDIGITELIKILKNKDIKANTEIINKLYKQSTTNGTLQLCQIKFDDGNYSRHVHCYSKQHIRNLVNRNSLKYKLDEDIQ